MEGEKKSTILIVDDNQTNLDILISALGDEYLVRVAPDGKRAIEEAASDPPDLVLLDIQLPEMDGYEVCRQLKAIENTGDIPVLFISSSEETIDKTRVFESGGLDYLTQPVQSQEVLARVKTHLELKHYKDHLEEMVKRRTVELEKQNKQLEESRENLRRSNHALQEAMKNLLLVKITAGVYWLQIPEAGLYVLCGCPADVVKLMMKKGIIALSKRNGVEYETGPNAILLSDILIQNGNFSNLAEFPILQMLYRQGFLLPNHSNNTGLKPVLIGAREQVEAQMKYIYHGNYGLTKIDDILATGISKDDAGEMMNLKKKFAFGRIRRTEGLLDRCIVEDEPKEIRNGVFVQRCGFNQYRFIYKDNSVVVDLNLQANETYESPYLLSFHKTEREYFAVIHTGEGDGWDTNRPCMASILMYLGRIYLIDAGPNILDTLRALSIDVSEIEGVFHTHSHDDHFAGLPTLMQSDHRLKFYATPLVRASVAKKLSALMSIKENKFFEYFDVHDLEFDVWNDLNGLEVKPIFSPHPVETNIFMFRTLGEDGYKTYAHLADITSLDVLGNMVNNNRQQDGISREFYNEVKANYLSPADIKKVDIGGGLIHGQTSDFREDSSNEIILAHTSIPLSEQQKEIGSERSFGTVDVLISANQNYLLKQAAHLLNAYFPTISLEQLRILLNAPMVTFNPGSIILKNGSTASEIYFILTGTAEMINSELKIENHLTNGCFVGDISFLRNSPSAHTWRAVSYVQALRFSLKLYSSFLDKYCLFEQVNSLLDKIDFLQNTALFGERISYPVQNMVAQNMILTHYDAGERIIIEQSPWLGLIKEGELIFLNQAGTMIDTIKAGEFFGEGSLFLDKDSALIFQCTAPSEIYFITNVRLLDIPIVHLKLLEVFTKRGKI